MTNSITNGCILLVALCGMLSPSLAQEAGEAVRIQGAIAEDVYAAGGTVDVLATVEGDVVVAGGRVTVDGQVSGDVMAAGGAVSVHADIDDDVRLAGGDITLSGAVGDDAIAAGGNVTLAPGGRVGGRAWLSGGRIDIAGGIGKELNAAGGRIVLSGQVKGDAALTGRNITIADTAIIDGNLIYRSPREAAIASGAQIRGTISYEPVKRPAVAVAAAVGGVGIILVLSLIVAGGALFLVFPRFIGTAVTTVRAEPWKCLGLGLAVFAATPIVFSALFMTVIGWILATVIASAYVILLLAGFLTGTFYVGEIGWGLFAGGELSRGKRLWSFVAALIVIILLGLVPVLGTLLVFVVMLMGVGVLNLDMYRAYIAQTGN